ncbi:hypothetical protein AWY89_10660 [Pasteurella multocida subsp. multocida]|nr:hypothetical protein AWY89_10660 [Pasteurella multocida subsp. multocida]
MKNKGRHPINEETRSKYNITPKPFRNTHMMKNRPSRFKEMTVLPFSHPIMPVISAIRPTIGRGIVLNTWNPRQVISNLVL